MPKTDHWYRRAFGADYLQRYAHRDDGEAAAFVDCFVAPILGAEEGTKLALDLCAGACRHSIAMAARGARVVAYDLSPGLLEAGRSRIPTQAWIKLVRGDMRWLPFPQCAFSLVVNAFTAFGYFDSDGENLGVLAEVARVLRPGGHFVLDFANRLPIVGRLGTVGRGALVPGPDGMESLEVRRMTSDLLRVERVRFPDAGATGPPVLLESVRLFSPAELLDALAGVGLVAIRTAGDYAGGAFDVETSDRLVVVARKSV